MSDNQRDLAGQNYSVGGQGPAQHGAQVTVHTSNGPVQGTFSNGYAIPNRS
jgi:hypothetical protein